MFSFRFEEIFFGAFRRSRRAFRYIFARLNPISLPQSRSQIPFPKLVPDSLAKDAAPIPNASGATQARMLPYILINKVQFGHWPLAIGHWLLAVGCWPLNRFSPRDSRGPWKRLVLIRVDQWRTEKYQCRLVSISGLKKIRSDPRLKAQVFRIGFSAFSAIL